MYTWEMVPLDRMNVFSILSFHSLEFFPASNSSKITPYVCDLISNKFRINVISILV